jgi:uncharacterized SAM-binding protein YcdF (DUF218 family)
MSTYTQPFFALLLVSATVVVFIRNGRRWFAPFVLSVLFLFSWRPAAWLGVGLLEAPYSVQGPASGVQAIVVLSSSVLPANPPREQPILGQGTYERCWYAAWLYSHGFPVPVLASGGSRPTSPYAIVMRDALQTMGVPIQMIWTEENSRSTHENAVFSAEILHRKGIHRIALVTEAYHMARAARCFRKQGIEVVVAPCGFLHSWQGSFQEFLPDWQAVSWNEETLHELGGLLWYRFKGWI